MRTQKRVFAFLLALALFLTGCEGMTSAEGTLSEEASSLSETVEVEEVPEASLSSDSSDSSASSVTESVEVSPEGSLSEPEEPELTAPTEVFLTVEEAAKMKAGDILPAEQLPEDTSPFFYRKKISKKVWKRMKGVSYKEGCPVSREELRYVRVLHWGFDGETHIGELVCNKSVAKEFEKIFRKLYKKGYPIEKMLLVDEYDGDDERSMEDNNTSCFNYRPISGTSTISRHAYGLAIDINPLYNPYITSRGYEPVNAGDYVDRDVDNPYMIDSEDPCYKLMDKYGFAWGGWWDSVKDYQHFEK